MHLYAEGSHVIARAPAKVNLFLEVLGRRDDGFHEIETVMCTINLFDTLRFESDPSGQVSFQWMGALGTRVKRSGTPDIADVPSDASNLVVRAVELLRSETGVDHGAKLGLHKRIPSAAGLGGGSSDAATALLAANHGWQLGLAQKELEKLAAKLGSDVPFFLYQSPALCRGRGENVEPLALSGRLYLVVVKPPVELSTVKVYNNYVASEHRVAWNRKPRPRQLSDVRLFNRLQSAAESLTPWIAKTMDLFTRLGVPLHQMTGSGSAYFGICASARHARQIASRLRQFQAGDVYCTTTCS